MTQSTRDLTSHKSTTDNGNRLNVVSHFIKFKKIAGLKNNAMIVQKSFYTNFFPTTELNLARKDKFVVQKSDKNPVVTAGFVLEYL